jgi:hypothetical protein
MDARSEAAGADTGEWIRIGFQVQQSTCPSLFFNPNLRIELMIMSVFRFSNEKQKTATSGESGRYTTIDQRLRRGP